MTQFCGFMSGESSAHQFWRIYAVRYGAGGTQGTDQLAVMGQGARISEVRMFDAVGDPDVLVNKASGGVAFSGFTNRIVGGLSTLSSASTVGVPENADVFIVNTGNGANNAEFRANSAFNGVIDTVTWDAWAAVYDDNTYVTYVSPVFLGYQFPEPVSIKQVSWYAVGALGANLGFVEYYIQYADSIEGPWTNACYTTQAAIGCCYNSRSTINTETGTMTRIP